MEKWMRIWSLAAWTFGFEQGRDGNEAIIGNQIDSCDTSDDKNLQLQIRKLLSLIWKQLNSSSVQRSTNLTVDIIQLLDILCTFHFSTMLFTENDVNQIDSSDSNMQQQPAPHSCSNLIPMIFNELDASDRQNFIKSRLMLFSNAKDGDIGAQNEYEDDSSNGSSISIAVLTIAHLLRWNREALLEVVSAQELLQSLLLNPIIFPPPFPHSPHCFKYSPVLLRVFVNSIVPGLLLDYSLGADTENTGSLNLILWNSIMTSYHPHYYPSPTSPSDCTQFSDLLMVIGKLLVTLRGQLGNEDSVNHADIRKILNDERISEAIWLGLTVGNSDHVNKRALFILRQLLDNYFALGFCLHIGSSGESVREWWQGFFEVYEVLLESDEYLLQPLIPTFLRLIQSASCVSVPDKWWHTLIIRLGHNKSIKCRKVAYMALLKQCCVGTKVAGVASDSSNGSMGFMNAFIGNDVEFVMNVFIPQLCVQVLYPESMESNGSTNSPLSLLCNDTPTCSEFGDLLAGFVSCLCRLYCCSNDNNASQNSRAIMSEWILPCIFKLNLPSTILFYVKGILDHVRSTSVLNVGSLWNNEDIILFNRLRNNSKVFSTTHKHLYAGMLCAAALEGGFNFKSVEFETMLSFVDTYFDFVFVESKIHNLGFSEEDLVKYLNAKCDEIKVGRKLNLSQEARKISRFHQVFALSDTYSSESVTTDSLFTCLQNLLCRLNRNPYLSNDLKLFAWSLFVNLANSASVDQRCLYFEPSSSIGMEILYSLDSFEVMDQFIGANHDNHSETSSILLELLQTLSENFRDVQQVKTRLDSISNQMQSFLRNNGNEVSASAIWLFRITFSFNDIDLSGIIMLALELRQSSGAQTCENDEYRREFMDQKWKFILALFEHCNTLQGLDFQYLISKCVDELELVSDEALVFCLRSIKCLLEHPEFKVSSDLVPEHIQTIWKIAKCHVGSNASMISVKKAVIEIATIPALLFTDEDIVLDVVEQVLLEYLDSIGSGLNEVVIQLSTRLFNVWTVIDSESKFQSLNRFSSVFLALLTYRPPRNKFDRFSHFHMPRWLAEQTGIPIESKVIDENDVRSFMLRLLLNTSIDSSFEFSSRLFDLVLSYIERIVLANKKKACRGFDQIGLAKFNVWQALLLMSRFMQGCDDELIESVLERIFKILDLEMITAVRNLMECTIALLVVRNLSIVKSRGFWKQIDLCTARISVCISFIISAARICQAIDATSEEGQLWFMTLYEEMFGGVIHGNHVVRFHALWAMILARPYLTNPLALKQMEFLDRNKDADKVRIKIESNHFHSCFNYPRGITLSWILFDFPVLVGGDPDYCVLPSRVFADKVYEDIIGHVTPSVIQHAAPMVENFIEPLGNYQKKVVINPNEEIEVSTFELENEQDRPRKRNDLIIVASLVDRVANIAGLCRTAEIFNASMLTIPDLGILKHSDFKSIAVSADRWMNLKECKPESLCEYLIELKESQGYTIVGVEQTPASSVLGDFKFPAKTAIVLGAEREGMPVEILDLVDFCVEIPQFGFIRSLNVHVSGALCVYECMCASIVLNMPLCIST